MTGPAFTGEWRDTNALQYHRARYYAPSLGIFPSLDPWEGLFDRPMSLNGYAWVEGNVVNLTDPSGEEAVPPYIPYPQPISSPYLRPADFSPRIGPAQTSLRWGMAGLLLYSTQSTLQPNGMICNAREAVSGLCHPVWDNPQTYRSTLQIPSHMWDLGDSCLALPLTSSIPLQAPDHALQTGARETRRPRQRAGMRVQLQEQTAGRTLHHDSTALYAEDEIGVVTDQVINALRQLRQHPSIKRREQTQANTALDRAITWTKNRPPYGIAQQGVNQTFSFNPQKPNETKRFDIENLIGHNLQI